MFENKVYDALNEWSHLKEQREWKMSVQLQKNIIEDESKCSHMKEYMKWALMLERVQ